MTRSKIAFENLRAEMARKELTISTMADGLGISRDTLSSKLARKRPISLDEALRLSRTYFPDHDIYYLFKELTVEYDDIA